MNNRFLNVQGIGCFVSKLCLNVQFSRNDMVTPYNLYESIGFEFMNERDLNNGELLFKYAIK